VRLIFSRFGPIRPAALLGVVALGLAAVPARAQFTGGAGAVAPAALPAPVVSYPAGGYYNPYDRWGGWGRWGTNWMQNPYEGYLNGAANVTTANAQYQLTIQQAKLARQEAIRSSYDTRRKEIEERQYELSLMPDPEQIRQQEMMRSLQRSRNNPPSTDIWSGKALNDLLRAIQDGHSHGLTGPTVMLSTDVVQHINLSTGVTYGSTGLLRDGGKLKWPFILRQSQFADPRAKIEGQVQQAVKQAQTGEVDVGLLEDLGASLKLMEQTVDARVLDITPTQYVQAMRYVRELKDAYKVLQQPDVAKYFRPAWLAQGQTVAELTRQMTQQGLRFAPAVSGDETYYTSLHRSMVDYDIGMMAKLTATMKRPEGKGP
jgi:hypothetical protein